MRNFYSAFTRLAMTISALLFFAPAQAITYTAMVSGNFSSTTTWGGLVPLSLTAGDVILIPVGVTVTMDNNITLNSSANLIVEGTLASASNNTALVLVNSNLSGTGTIAVDSMSVNLPSGFAFTGNISADNFTSVSTNINTAANISVANNLYLAGSLTSLTSGSIALGNGATIVVNGGSISVSGSGMLDLTADYTVNYIGNTNVSTGIELTGPGLSGISLNMNNANVSLSSDLVVNTTLTMNTGKLVLNGFDLTLAGNSDLVVTGTATICSDLNSDITINTNGNLTSSLPMQVGQNVVQDLSININNITGNFNLGSDLVVSGMLTLTSGTLNLNGNDLTFAGNGDFSNFGIGAIYSSVQSDITFMTTQNITGAIRFRPGGNIVNDLTMNMPYSNHTVSVGSPLTVTGTLALGSGLLDMGANNLTVSLSGNVTGGSATSYVITSNGGNLVMNLTANENMTWHVGTTQNYAPAVLLAGNTCATSDISIGVDDVVLSAGYFGTDISNTAAMVDATWSVSSSVTAGLNMDMQFMWSADMELNNFDRTKAYVSQFTTNAWDVSATASASTNGMMYGMNRSNVTSPGVFAVVDENTALKTGNVAAANAELEMYPNPAADMIHFTTTAEVKSIEIYDISGRKISSPAIQGNSFSVSELAPGYYNAVISGKDLSISKHFIKAN